MLLSIQSCSTMPFIEHMPVIEQLPVIEHKSVLEQKNRITRGKTAKIAELDFFLTQFKIA